MTTAADARPGGTVMAPGRVLITGVTGFIARHLVPHLLAGGWKIHGLHRRPMEALPWPGVEERLCDLTGDPGAVHAAVQAAQPDLIVHLAAMIPHDRVGAAWSWTEANGRATEHLLSACRDCEPQPRVVIVSSGAVYGDGHPDAPPVDEDRPFAPATAYGVSKVLIEALAVRASLAWGVPVVRVRLFNVTGPGEPPHLAVGSFVRQLTEIALGHRPPVLTVGDLTTARDFLDVRDAAHGLFLAATRGEPGQVYNVCSGAATRMEHVVAALLELANLGRTVAVESHAAEPDPIRFQRGSARRLSELTGWRPTYELRRTLVDVLEDCRVREQAPTQASGS